MDGGSDLDCQWFLPLMRDKELPDSWLVGVLINPGSDDLTDGCPPVLRPGPQHPVVLVGRQHRGEKPLVSSSKHVGLRAQLEPLAPASLVVFRPSLQQHGLGHRYLAISTHWLQRVSKRDVNLLRV